ncbi:MAG: hypothetical protein J6O39_05450 [Treponema sp.]|nr:hypothetical protein [Treponema sp.]
MMRSLRNIASGALLTVLFFSCSEVADHKIYSTAVEEGVVFEKDGEKWVTLNVNSISSMLQDARTVLPDCPDLYFSLTASTVMNSSGDADVSFAAAAASGEFVPDVYYASQKNKMSGLNVTLKVGRSYYFTVYGTEESPAQLSSDSTFFGSDYTGKTASSDFGALSRVQRDFFDTLQSGIYTNSYTYDSELVYYGVREKLGELLLNSAVVKGTSQFYFEENAEGGISVYAGSDNSGTLSRVVSVDVDSTGTEGTGYAFIPVDLAATYSTDSSDVTGAYSVTQLGLSVAKVRLQWTSRNDSDNDGYMDIPVSYAGNTYINSRYNTKFALKPYINVGNYDVDLILYSKDTSGNYSDVFLIHDTMEILKNQESVLLGSGSHYSSGIEFTMTYAGDPSSTGENASSTYNYTGEYVYSGYTGKAEKGYKISASNIKNYFRTVFYVSGSGGNLISCTDGSETGSILYPFKSVADAVDAIFNGTKGVANGYGASTTEWNIIIDGIPEVQRDVSIVYDSSVAGGRDFNVVIRNYNGSSTVNIVKYFTVENSSSNDMNFTFTNITWSNPDFKVFENTGTGNINVVLN